MDFLATKISDFPGTDNVRPRRSREVFTLTSARRRETARHTGVIIPSAHPGMDAPRVYLRELGLACLEGAYSHDSRVTALALALVRPRRQNPAREGSRQLELALEWRRS